MLKKLIKLLLANKLLVCVVLLATALRFYKITDNPPSLNWDEVSHGYNAYSLLKTGKDEWGKVFPIIFRAYGDYKLPVYIYLTSISVGLFGLNAFAVRLTSVIAGVLTVVFTYLLVKELFSRKKTGTFLPNIQMIAVVSAFLVAVEPWSFFLSRGAFEANLALTFIVAGVYFFIRAINRTATHFLFSAIFLGFSVWTYNSARVFVPILIFFLVCLYRRDIKNCLNSGKLALLKSGFVLLIFLGPMFIQLLSPVGQARYSWVSIIDDGAVARINEARVNSNLSFELSTLLHNKITYFVTEFTKNWMSHYNGDFLFFSGGSDYQFNIPSYGLIYPVNSVFLLMGIFYSLKKKSRELLLVLGWFFMGSAASSLTSEAPHTLRAITMIPSPMILTAIGMVSLWEKIRRKSILINYISPVAYLTVVLLLMGNYLSNYFNKYKNTYSWSWQYGYKEMVNDVKNKYSDYDKIIITKKYGEPHEFLLFYWPWDPDRYQKDPNLVRFEQTNWFWVDGFDKFFFVNDWQIVEEGTDNFEFNLESGGIIECLPKKTRCMLITSPNNVPKGWQRLKTVNYSEGKPAFEIYEN